MALIAGEHLTRFAYSQPVACEPLLIRLRPREDAAQRLREYRIDVRPKPEGISHWIDAEGNGVCCCWWQEPMQSLEIRTSFVAETCRSNPFDFLLFADAATLPARYSDGDAPMLAPYRDASSVSSRVADWTSDIARASQGRTMLFLGRLCERIHAEVSRLHRHEGDPYSGEQTLDQRAGACRDMAVLFIEACRSQGLAARFVSGYAWHGNDDADHDLHAWAEVYVPGGGWRGFDPSRGLAVALDHIAVAASAAPPGAAPTTGTFWPRGTAVTLSADVTLRRAGDSTELS